MDAGNACTYLHPGARVMRRCQAIRREELFGLLMTQSGWYEAGIRCGSPATFTRAASTVCTLGAARHLSLLRARCTHNATKQLVVCNTVSVADKKVAWSKTAGCLVTARFHGPTAVLTSTRFVFFYIHGPLNKKRRRIISSSLATK